MIEICLASISSLSYVLILLTRFKDYVELHWLSSDLDLQWTAVY